MTVSRQEWLQMRESGSLNLETIFEGIKLNKTVNQNMTFDQFKASFNIIDSLPRSFKQKLLFEAVNNIDKYFNITILMNRENEQIWIESAT